ncbi:hypothetical protein HPB48_008288 [Haemaphysalis longicornis]|uniref:C2 domain-containing protein n=1 Tax=Haemaphysalis longicornis TaxID=44386 RepID=A0A9J6GPM2_HAELO|nr:hypothetical protein HPB48_008288 [Haemaphysalis longicornis]
MGDLSQGTALRLCAQCVRLSKDCIGKPTRPLHASTEKLRKYVRRVYADVFAAHGEAAITERAAALPAPRLQVIARLVHAEGLREPVDTYVSAWIEPADKVTSSLRSKSSAPRWDNEIVLDVPDWRHSVLNVQLWQRTRGWRRHQLLGRISQPLAELPCMALDRWEPLAAGGTLHLRLELSAVESSEDRQSAVRDHATLCQLFLADSVARAGDRAQQWRRWEDCLGDEPLTLLRQHALQQGISAVEELGCRLKAATAARAEHGRLNYRVLEALLQELRLAGGPPPPDPALTGVEVQARALLARLHDAFCLKDRRDAHDLLGVLSSCSLVETLSKRPVTDLAREEIRRSTRNWHLQVAVQGLSGAESLVADLGRVLLLLGHFHRAADVVFSKAWNESYTQITAPEIDNLLDSHIRPRIVALSNLVQTAKKNDRGKLVHRSLEAFQLLRAFISAVCDQLPSQRPRLAMESYLEWFGATVVIEWFESAQKPLLAAIPAAVDADILVPQAGKSSSSARFVADAIEHRLVRLWICLDWPQPQVARRFALLVAACAVHFAQCTERRTRRQKFYQCPTGVSKRLCVAISNIGALVPSLASAQRSILLSFYNQSDDTVVELCAPLKDAAATLGSCALKLEEALLVRAHPELRRLLAASMRCTEATAQERALLALASHLNACLSTLHLNLEAAAFGNALLRLWQGLLLSVQHLHGRTSHLQGQIFCLAAAGGTPPYAEDSAGGWSWLSCPPRGLRPLPRAGMPTSKRTLNSGAGFRH